MKLEQPPGLKESYKAASWFTKAASATAANMTAASLTAANMTAASLTAASSWFKTFS